MWKQQISNVYLIQRVSENKKQEARRRVAPAGWLVDVCVSSAGRSWPAATCMSCLLMVMRPGRPHSIIPDALIRAALPAVVTARGLRRARAMLEQALLFDVKTIHANSPHYHSAHAQDEQRGAVRHRERRVAPAYTAHAKRLDTQLYGAGVHHIANRLRAFGDTRGLVSYALRSTYGEASDDVFTRSSPLPPPSLPCNSGAPQEHAAQLRCTASLRVDATAVSAYAQCRRSRVRPA